MLSCLVLQDDAVAESDMCSPNTAGTKYCHVVLCHLSFVTCLFANLCKQIICGTKSNPSPQCLRSYLFQVCGCENLYSELVWRIKAQSSLRVTKRCGVNGNRGNDTVPSETQAQGRPFSRHSNMTFITCILSRISRFGHSGRQKVYFIQQQLKPRTMFDALNCHFWISVIPVSAVYFKRTTCTIYLICI